MAAYSAVACFRQTLEQLLDSDLLPLDCPKPQIESLHKKLCSLQSSLDRITFVPKYWRERMNELQTRIREAIYAAQDKIDYSISTLEKNDEILFSKIADGIDLLVKEAAEVEAIQRDPGPQNSWGENPQPPEFISLSGKKKIVGQDKDASQIIDCLCSRDRQLQIIPITGLPGLGKTTLARSIYEDQRIKTQFNVCAWVTVSQDYNYQEMFSKMLSSMESNSYQLGHYTTQGNEQTLRNRVHQELYNRKYLMVIDDIWEASVWHRVRLALPDNDNGSRIIVTTRIRTVAESIQSSGYIHEMQPLGLEDSWELLCDNVFGNDPCPPVLKGIGRSIAEKCNGLPLSITVVGGLLSQKREYMNHWEMIEEDTGYAASAADGSYQQILSLSYNYLPEKLKGCFLYMGAFPEDSEILVSKLIKLWVAEGFLSASAPDQDLEAVARDSLRVLVDRNLVSIRKISSNGGTSTQPSLCGPPSPPPLAFLLNFRSPEGIRCFYSLLH